MAWNRGRAEKGFEFLAALQPAWLEGYPTPPLLLHFRCNSRGRRGYLRDRIPLGSWNLNEYGPVVPQDSCCPSRMAMIRAVAMGPNVLWGLRRGGSGETAELAAIRPQRDLDAKEGSIRCADYRKVSQFIPGKLQLKDFSFHCIRFVFPANTGAVSTHAAKPGEVTRTSYPPSGSTSSKSPCTSACVSSFNIVLWRNISPNEDARSINRCPDYIDNMTAYLSGFLLLR